MSIYENGIVVGTRGSSALAIGRHGVARPRQPVRQPVRKVRTLDGVVSRTPRVWFAKLAALGILLGIAAALLVI